jgi:hypothetical protein
MCEASQLLAEAIAERRLVHPEDEELTRHDLSAAAKFSRLTVPLGSTDPSHIHRLLRQPGGFEGFPMVEVVPARQARSSPARDRQGPLGRVLVGAPLAHGPEPQNRR